MGTSFGLLDAWFNQKTGKDAWCYFTGEFALGAGISYSMWYFPQMSMDPDLGWSPNWQLTTLVSAGAVGGCFDANARQKSSREYWKHIAMGGAIGFGSFEAYSFYSISRIFWWTMFGY